MCHLLCILSCWEVDKESCDKGGVYNLLEPDVIDMGCKESMQSCPYFSPQLIPSPLPISPPTLNCLFLNSPKPFRVEVLSPCSLLLIHLHCSVGEPLATCDYRGLKMWLP